MKLNEMSIDQLTIYAREIQQIISNYPASPDQTYWKTQLRIALVRREQLENEADLFACACENEQA